MKKIIFICAGFFILLVCVWIGIRVFGIFNTYKNASSANEPNIAVNQIVMASNLKEAKKGGLIVVKANGVPCIYRLCAAEGDQIEIKKGEVYLNGKIMIQNYDTKHSYNFSNEIYNELIDSGKIQPGETMYAIGNEIHMEIIDAIAKKANIYQYKEVKMPVYRDEEIEQKWSNRWNADNFGPVLVPADNLFVLGDNRSNARDSRYIGFINKSELLGVIL
ncbi:signal peptidase I [Pedobacter sp. KACC 23697]|uniref:Signal peptidase I n=1 Tax=Pedobacter sp. KACC 23697 TaxID=3149230 RepID=A0AAU7K094_9SPHI